MDKENKDKKAENQKKIAYLRKYYHAKKEEQMILDEIQRLREGKMFPSFVMDDMPHGNGSSDLSEYAALLDDEMTKLKEQRLKCMKIYSDISRRIRKVEDDNQRELLMHRYIKCLKWEDIAVTMGYSWRNIHKIHSRALDAIESKECMEVHTKSMI